MKVGGAWILAALIAALGCGKKTDATPVPDAAPKEVASCLNAKNARAYTWRKEPLELALDVDLDWTCPELFAGKIELHDVDIGAAFGEPKRGERYRLDKTGGFGEWDDPFLAASPTHALLVYSVPKIPATVGVRYGGVTLVPSVPIVDEPPKVPPKGQLRVVSASTEPGAEKGTHRVTALVEIKNAPRTVGGDWKEGTSRAYRLFYFRVEGAAEDGTGTFASTEARRVLDVDDDLAPIDTPVASLPPRPARRLMLVELPSSRLKTLTEVHVGTGTGPLVAKVEAPPKLVLPKETRARLDQR